MSTKLYALELLKNILSDEEIKILEIVYDDNLAKAQKVEKLLG